MRFLCNRDAVERIVSPRADELVLPHPAPRRFGQRRLNRRRGPGASVERDRRAKFLSSARESRYGAAMNRLILALAAASLALGAAPASAAAGAFKLVNATDTDITSLSIRRFGTQPWQALVARPPRGASVNIDFSDPDCAFDIRATLAGGDVATWSGVNLCEAKSVTLNRNAKSGANWVDYD